MPQPKWRAYEELAQSIIKELATEFGLEGIEGKQIIPGKSGTNWEIDAKGIRSGDSGVILIECRRYLNYRIKQEQMAAVAYRIDDIGAVGGITVSPLEPQEGARILAEYENITHMTLDPDSTPENYFVNFLSKAFSKVTETIAIGDFYELEIWKDGKRID
ncbi:hypothetical protein DNJ95_02390 [Stutzerimonas kirkiae]|uniref:Restriction endonuclease type IV Mrr domain-containing protein n=1 Tax=Stutzerimonas kirkiae TaxID=2211392 RepID=A0A4Q9RFN8_9GAMM|nr:hypothetical protein [Stutzerimonas kirkiae]TBV00028.1 hypothetical protein DNJ96_01720 [Stutzerimonas kirkiae]TBV05734.1 hypothetical protein DNJ95_02390 [Stutzerimonas kirkiae]